MSEVTQPTTRLRASLANAAFAVEDRVAIGVAEVARGVRELGGRARKLGGRASAAAEPALDAVKWPFERLAWGFQRHLLWPLQDRTDGWSQTTRRASAAGVGVVALGACALGLVLASGGSNSSTAELAAAPTAPPPAPTPAPVAKAPAAPVLHGVAPTFKPETGVSNAKGAGQSTAAAKAKGSSHATSTPDTPDPAIASVAGTGEPAGPAALKVARRFAGAFVLYEIGQGTTKARGAFQATATPELARSLLHRPPRLPANVKVPKAKVVNVVAAPSHGGVFPVSVSLLRVGVTSELRLNMQRQGRQPGNGPAGTGPAAGKARSSQNSWRVTEVTG